MPFRILYTCLVCNDGKFYRIARIQATSALNLGHVEEQLLAFLNFKVQKTEQALNGIDLGLLLSTDRCNLVVIWKNIKLKIVWKQSERLDSTSTARFCSSTLKVTMSSFCRRSRLFFRLVMPNSCVVKDSPASLRTCTKPQYSG